MSIDTNDLLAKVLAALRGEIAQGWSKIRSFAEKQSRLIAKLAAHIAQSRATGDLRHDDELYASLVQSLKNRAHTLALAAARMTAVTIEKAWNAVVGVVWGAVNQTLGTAGLLPLPIPRVPRT